MTTERPLSAASEALLAELSDLPDRQWVRPMLAAIEDAARATAQAEVARLREALVNVRVGGTPEDACWCQQPNPAPPHHWYCRDARAALAQPEGQE